MQQYQSHKIVEASVIRGFTSSPPSLMIGDNADGVWKPVNDLPENFFGRGYPQIGDYFIQYPDGYMSWSPKGTFEAGYTLVNK